MSPTRSGTRARQGKIELKTDTFIVYTTLLSFCLCPLATADAFGSHPVLSNLPVDRFSPWLVSALAVVLLLIVVLYHRRTRRPSRAGIRTFRFGEKLADIDYATELEQVGPLRPGDTPNAFTDGIESLSRLCHQTLKRSQGKSLALVGTRPESGTTTIAIALARSLASSGKRTLLLDLNFERPMVQLATGATSVPGISNYLLTGLIDGIVSQDPHSALDIIGIGNLPTHSVQEYLGRNDRYIGSVTALMSMYERVIVDCAPTVAGQPDVSRILSSCDLRLLVIDTLHDTVQSPGVQGLLRIHRRWHHGTTLLLRNKVRTVADTSRPPLKGLSPQASLRPVHGEKWILQQTDEAYTLKLTEMRYRPVLTRRQISNYAGHQVACFRLSILDEVNYLLILGQFPDRETALQAAQALGLTQSSVRAVSFADIKKGIRLELRRRQAEAETA